MRGHVRRRPEASSARRDTSAPPRPPTASAHHSATLIESSRAPSALPSPPHPRRGSQSIGERQVAAWTRGKGPSKRNQRCNVQPPKSAGAPSPPAADGTSVRSCRPSASATPTRSPERAQVPSPRYRPRPPSAVRERRLEPSRSSSADTSRVTADGKARAGAGRGREPPVGIRPRPRNTPIASSRSISIIEQPALMSCQLRFMSIVDRPQGL